MEKIYKGLFVSDLDGTLLNSSRKFSEVDLYALERLRAKNYLVTIATGRSDYSLKSLFQRLGCLEGNLSLPVDYLIFSTGAGIMDFPEGALLKSSCLSQSDVEQIVSRLLLLPVDFMIHRPVPATQQFLYRATDGDNPDFYARISMYTEFATTFSPDLLQKYEGATEILCIVPEKSGHQTASMLSEMFPQFSVVKATSPLDGQTIWIEIFSGDVSKSQAVKWLATNLMICRESVGAIGNDYNDEDLLQWAGKGYVVANAPKSLSCQFHTVAANSDGGVSEAVRDWLTLQEDESQT